MGRILLHACCAPCATHTVNRLREEGFDVTAFWYNPNIHPFTEHRHRLESMRTLAEAIDLPLLVADGYDMIDYFRAVVGHEGERCGECFRMRLDRTATVASDNGFTLFTTTLLISPYQKHELLRRTGEAVARERGIDFHYEDFRTGFRESQRLSRELDLYHQKYCGCIYSEWERFGKVDIARMLENT
jgi:predicted adenine nucleotide alpha hydrolase (AANH) superfamily ATPase